jgi:thiol-disulfide isomerase/thioredoxin
MDLLKLLIISMTLFVAYATQATPLKPLELSTLKYLENSNAEFRDLRLYYLWASWCPDCRQKLRAEIPNLSEKYKDFSVITVNMDRREEKATHFIDDEGLKLPVVRDEDKIFAKKLKLFAIPSWVVMKKSGDNWEIVDKQSGSEMEKIEQAMNKAQGGNQ